jgi:hypothetical protein
LNEDPAGAIDVIGGGSLARGSDGNQLQYDRAASAVNAAYGHFVAVSFYITSFRRSNLRHGFACRREQIKYNFALASMRFRAGATGCGKNPGRRW